MDMDRNIESVEALRRKSRENVGNFKRNNSRSNIFSNNNVDSENSDFFRTLRIAVAVLLFISFLVLDLFASNTETTSEQDNMANDPKIQTQVVEAISQNVTVNEAASYVQGLLNSFGNTTESETTETE